VAQVGNQRPEENLRGGDHEDASKKEAELQLEASSWSRDEQLHTWRLNWERIIPFMSYPEDIRREIYIANIIESMNSSLRKVLKNRTLIRE
jgi:putative transposase